MMCEPEPKRKKILILYSGGLDSLIMGRMAEVFAPDEEVVKMFFDIGQSYAHKETLCLPLDTKIRSVDWLKASGNKTHSKDNSSGDIYIPGRNLALAVLGACQELPDEIWLGALQGEIHNHATDKNYYFANLLSELLTYVLKPFIGDRQVNVRYPLADKGFNKLRAVEWYVNSFDITERQKAVAEVMKSSSCLSGGYGNCGHCVVCVRRWGIFRQLFNIEEPYVRHPIKEMTEQTARMIEDMINGKYYDEHRREEILPAFKDYVEKEYLEDFKKGGFQNTRLFYLAGQISRKENENVS